MLIEDITLSDYSDDELNKFVREAQEVIRNRKNKQLYILLTTTKTAE